MLTRQTARLLVVDDQKRLLLFHVHDHTALHENHPHMLIYWLTPGGGVEPDETFEQAAHRELWEETGLTVGTLGPQVWHHERVVLLSRGRTLLQERFYLAHVASPEVSIANLLPYEQETHRSYRWWTLEEITRSDEHFLPLQLPQHFAAILEGNIPAEPLRLLS